MLQLTSSDVLSMAGQRAIHTIAHLTGVTAIGAGGAIIIDKVVKNKSAKLTLATAATVGGIGVSMLGHIASDRVVETVGDGILAAGLLTFAFHVTPKLFARQLQSS